ncbi:MAG TPA: hypothetical protein VHV32_13935 [Candidatus Angelobacter sp.]|jgi:hypothetical protein|nr:hypothetical protein [Candidatus Angelobacter sp.]
MKVTSDRIKARAQQLRNNGFKLSGSMVRSTLELNAGARTHHPSKEISAREKAENTPSDPKETKVA